MTHVLATTTRRAPTSRAVRSTLSSPWTFSCTVARNRSELELPYTSRTAPATQWTTAQPRSAVRRRSRSAQSAGRVSTLRPGALGDFLRPAGDNNRGKARLNQLGNQVRAQETTAADDGDLVIHLDASSKIVLHAMPNALGSLVLERLDNLDAGGALGRPQGREL